MPWAFLVFMVVYGLTCILFAFMEPPGFLRTFYRVPAIFVFLPERWVEPAGRIFVGVCAIGVGVYFGVRIMPATTP